MTPRPPTVHAAALVARWCVAAGVALAVAGCQTTTREGCDICTTSAVVYGHIRDGSGAPIPNVTIHVDAFATSGSGLTPNPVGATNIVRQSDASGAFRDQPLSLLGPFHATLTVRAIPTETSGFVETAVSGAQVDFRSDYPGGDRDSVQVDIVLPRTGTP
jgi:hypothetical protein